MRLSILLLLQFLLFIQLCTAQQRTVEPYKVYRLQKPIKFDGLSDDEEWKNVAPLPMTMIFPKFRGTPSGRTEIRIAYDKTYLYFSGQFFYADSTTVRGNKDHKVIMGMTISFLKQVTIHVFLFPKFLKTLMRHI